MEPDSSRADDATLVLDVWLLSHTTDRLLDEDLRSLGLTSKDFWVYSLLLCLGPATLAQVARWAGLPQPTVSDMMWRITARGHVDSVPSPDDAGSRLIRLTDKGHRFTTQAAAVLAQRIPELRRDPEVA